MKALKALMHENLHPTLPGFYSDPSICRAGDDYYLTTSTFEYFPGCPLFHSRDLKHWTQVGHVLNRPEQLPLDRAWISGGIFAPTLRFHGGRFFLITTNPSAPDRNKGNYNFITHTADPLGEWSDPLWIEGMWGIDPDLFWDEDGTCYAQWSRREKGLSVADIVIGQAKIDPLKGRLLEAPRTLWEGSGGLGVEGPHLYKVNDWYYLSCAEGGTEFGHMQTLARSRSAQGPFENHPCNPVLSHRSLHTAVHAVGHADIVEAPSGEWFGVCHGIRALGYPKFHTCGRETFAFPVTWGDDDWPSFGVDRRLPETAITEPGVATFQDDFSNKNQPLQWTYCRNPQPENYQREKGSLTLKGWADRICENNRATWIGVRQQQPACACEAILTIDFDGDGEAGLTAFQNLQYHACVGLRQKGGQVECFTRIRMGELVWEETHPCAADYKGLRIMAEPLRYHFEVCQPGRHERLKSFDSRLLSTEFGGRFTGVFFALYAEGGATLRAESFSIQ